ncbi:MAG TPA: porin [Steroidobacteraceae bacterium]|nr:porin [Steroidobacteraceae bacterium]
MRRHPYSWRRAAAMLLLAALGAPSLQAAETKPSIQQQIEQLQQALEAQKAQLEAQQKLLEQQAALIEQLRQQAQQAGEAADTAAKVTALEQTVAQAKLKEQESARVSIANGRPTITSGDGRQSASLRAVVQLDMAHHEQDAAGPLTSDFRRGSVGGSGNREIAAAQDLSDGAYFRRARMGFEGRLARDFDYRLMLELGGAGTEGPTRINDAWIAYSGFGPFRLQLGAFSPAANMEDSTSVEDLLFPERATPSELSRTLAGADGRIGFAVRGSGARWMSSLTLTTRTVNDAEVFDSQRAAVGRFGYLVATSDSYNVHLGTSGTKVFRPADQGATASGARYPIRFRDRPEIRVDSTRLIDTGSLDADSAYALGVELGMNWKNWLLQAENFWYGVERREPTTLPDPSFGGYYVQTSWVLTGERHRYNVANGSFQSPRARVPFSSQGGYGAWELAVRYSHTDLDFHEGLAGTAATADGVRGGVQNIWTVGLNWYLNANFRLMLDYMRIDVDRLNPAGAGNMQPFGPPPGTPPLGVQIGQDLDVIALRSQYAF